MKYVFSLSQLQIEILLETAQAFVDNKKLLHLADQDGNVVGLPLTEAALNHLIRVFEQQQLDGKQEVQIETVQLGEGLLRVRVQLANAPFEYEVNEEEFDPQ